VEECWAATDVCISRTKLSDGAFPHLAFSALGYDSVHHGYNQWNGVRSCGRIETSPAVRRRIVRPYE
jgi:exodeoxyribonuclease-3